MSVAAACVVVLIAVISAQGEELSNKYCPVTTSELAEEQFFFDYQDRRIYFCCDKCKKDFLGDPESYLANLESGDAVSKQEPHDHHEGEHEHGEDASEATTEQHEQDLAASHDHATDHGESSSLIGFAGKFHPMLTHFPIALILSALLFSILGVVFRTQTFDVVSVYSMYLAALMGIATVILGLAAGSAASYPSFLSEYFDWHRLLGITTGVVTLLTAYAGSRMLRRSSKGTIWLYRILLFVNAALVGVTGHLGATLVFGPDHFRF